jgi:hypothetical protein
MTGQTKTTVEDIRAALVGALGDYGYVGLRVIDSAEHETGAVTVGDTLPASYRWDDGEWTGERLAGASAIAIRSAEDLDAALALARIYWGDQLVLVAGEFGQHGQDDGEILIRDAVALAVVSRDEATSNRGW